MLNKKKSMLFVLISVIMMFVVACGGKTNTTSNGVESQSSSKDSSSETSTSTGDKSFDGQTIRAATHDPKTAAYVFTSALGEITKDVDGLTIDVLPYAGGIGNVPLVNDGEVDFGISFNIAAKWGKEGIVAFDKPHENISSLGASMGYYNIGIIVRDSFLKKHKLTSLADIKEKKIPVKLITNPTGAMAELITRVTLEGYGLDYETIKSYGGSVELTSSDVIIGAMKDGTADIFITTISSAHAVVTELALTTDVTMIGIKEDEVKDYLADIGFIRDSTYNPAEYGQDEVLESPGFNVTYIINKDVDEDLAYLLAKRLSENQPALANAHAVMKEFDPKIAGHADINGIPLHPGAKRYYEEVGAVD